MRKARWVPSFLEHAQDRATQRGKETKGSEPFIENTQPEE
jgi:hypothetical protein